MLIKSQELPPIGTNAFVLIDEDRKECLVIDAPERAHSWASSVAEAHECAVVGLVLTHGHWDHILDAHLFAEAGIPVYGHRADTKMFETPHLMTSYAVPGLEMKAVKIDYWIAGGDSVELLGRDFEIRHVPGHCPGNVLIYNEDADAAFVGDAIFAGSIGRYDLPGGDFSILEKSIKQEIYTLPDETVIYPGHGPQTSVKAEKSSNPYVRG